MTLVLYEILCYYINMIRYIRRLSKKTSRLLTGFIRRQHRSHILLFVGFANLILILYALIVGGTTYKALPSASPSPSVKTASKRNVINYRAEVSALAKSYTDRVTDACERYGIPEYTDLAMAMIEQESSGKPPDVMQADQSPFNTEPPIDSVSESINCGIQELKECLKLAKVKGPSNIKRIKLALQGYNYGYGYISWALERNGGYTRDNAALFSEIMKERHEYSIYGDPLYVPHVLRYYNKETADKQNTPIS